VVAARTSHAATRVAAWPAHRARLAELHAAGTLVTAGPWADDSGALLVFDTDRSEVDGILADDPYYTAPGVAVVAVREWRPLLS